MYKPVFRPVALAAGLALLAACSQEAPAPAAPVETAAADAAPALPEPVNGWVEHPLADGVIKVQPASWRTDVIEIPVPAGKGLEYKLMMKKGDAIVYSIAYGDLEHPGLMEVEFHGHTEKNAQGVGDLMFYSKGGGAAQSGQFEAPWDGIHGWYLKNDSSRDVVVTLNVAGFYELEAGE